MSKKGKGISLPATLPPGRSKSKEDIAKKPTTVMKKPSMRSMKKK